MMSFISIAALANDYEVASNALLKSTGRIILVQHGPDFLKVDNICSGILADKNKIITASHCFYRAPHEVSPYPETYFFDIDGVTSRDLGVAINSLKNSESKILGNKIKTAKNILDSIPKITKVHLHPEYIRSAKSVEGTGNAPAPQHDVAEAFLSRSINTSTIEISEYIDGEKIYLAGQGGMFLEGKINVIQCIAGLPAYNYMVKTVGESAGRVPRSRKSRIKVADTTEFQLARYKNFYETAILEYCEESIVRGYSGGPHAVVRNGEVFLVGVTSQMFESEMGLSGRKIAGAKISQQKD
jgi:hypothetical protein